MRIRKPSRRIVGAAEMHTAAGRQQPTDTKEELVREADWPKA